MPSNDAQQWRDSISNPRLYMYYIDMWHDQNGLTNLNSYTATSRECYVQSTAIGIYAHILKAFISDQQYKKYQHLQ